MRIDNSATNPPTLQYVCGAIVGTSTDETCGQRAIKGYQSPSTPKGVRTGLCAEHAEEANMMGYRLYDLASPNQLVNKHNQPADEWLIELCDDYLSQLHAGSWGRTFYITNDDGRRAAAEFLATTIEGVNNARQQQSTRR